jgi:hypothetical protein
MGLEYMVARCFYCCKKCLKNIEFTARGLRKN